MISAVIEFENGDVVVNNSPTKIVDKEFKKGFYIATQTDEGIKIRINKLQEIHEPYVSNTSIKTDKIINSFFKKGIKEKINKLGFLHKLGILYHGIQGTGKTSLMNFFAYKLVENNDAICFHCNSERDLIGAISMAISIREIQNNLIIFVCDEFERFARDAESEMKNFLDGNNSIDNSIVFASTNYFDKVPETLSKRPSRFGVVEEIKGVEDVNVIKNIINSKNSLLENDLFNEKEIDLLSNTLAQKGATLDQIKNEILNKATNSFYKTEVIKKEIGYNKNKSKEKEILEFDVGYDFQYEDLFSKHKYEFKVKKQDKSI